MFDHNNNRPKDTGENIYKARQSNKIELKSHGEEFAKKAVQVWYNEVDDYLQNPSSPNNFKYTRETGHFT